MAPSLRLGEPAAWCGRHWPRAKAWPSRCAFERSSFVTTVQEQQDRRWPGILFSPGLGWEQNTMPHNKVGTKAPPSVQTQPVVRQSSNWRRPAGVRVPSCRTRPPCAFSRVRVVDAPRHHSAPSPLRAFTTPRHDTTPRLHHSAPSPLRAFTTPRLHHSAPSPLRAFTTPRLHHSAPSPLRAFTTPRLHNSAPSPRHGPVDAPFTTPWEAVDGLSGASRRPP